jgi:hypothetical protein
MKKFLSLLLLTGLAVGVTVTTPIQAWWSNRAKVSCKLREEDGSRRPATLDECITYDNATTIVRSHAFITNLTSEDIGKNLLIQEHACIDKLLIDNKELDSMIVESFFHLNQAKFKDCHIKEMRFRVDGGGYWQDCKLTNVKIDTLANLLWINRSVFEKSSIGNINIFDGYYGEVHFLDVVFTGSNNFKWTRFGNGSFKGCSVDKDGSIVFDGCHFEEIDFHHSFDFSNVTFKNCTFIDRYGCTIELNFSMKKMDSRMLYMLLTQKNEQARKEFIVALS